MSDPSTLKQSGHATLRAVWEEAGGAAQPCNQFAATLGLPTQQGVPEAVYLTLGNAEPPFLVGTEAEISQQLQEMGGQLPVRSLGRFVLTRGRVDELIKILQTAAQQFDQAQAQGGAK
ncbi:hypothetical protein [Streptomyces sp. OM5714]|uniref:hypothetical protein n=1 Tax=Streptomyces sp. OM5714 TaxID=2602736 RepID=UPI0013D9C59D|nr:hypothetical protein [Streptomyces sp. OM5714]